jgi:hypothetical protein
MNLDKFKNYNQDKEFENYLIQNSSLLIWMNNLLEQNQFTENFLIKTRNYYDSKKCLQTQKNLSVYFCFKYLYDTPNLDSKDNWTDYNDILIYFTNKYKKEYIENIYINYIQEKNNLI